jgi:hypothetical protein
MEGNKEKKFRINDLYYTIYSIIIIINIIIIIIIMLYYNILCLHLPLNY